MEEGASDEDIWGEHSSWGDKHARHVLSTLRRPVWLQ